MAPDPTAAPVPDATRTRQKLILLLAAVLFFGWISWLATMAFTVSKPVVLSRPQLLISNLDVIADVDDLNNSVVVREVFWPRDAPEGRWLDKKFPVTNLQECNDHGWEGPGRYILALWTDGESFAVAPTPPSPGYPRSGGKAGPARIYRETPQTRAQLLQIEKGK